VLTGKYRTLMHMRLAGVHSSDGSTFLREMTPLPPYSSATHLFFLFLFFFLLLARRPSKSPKFCGFKFDRDEIWYDCSSIDWQSRIFDLSSAFHDGCHDVTLRIKVLPSGECTRGVCPAHMPQLSSAARLQFLIYSTFVLVIQMGKSRIVFPTRMIICYLSINSHCNWPADNTITLRYWSQGSRSTGFHVRECVDSPLSSWPCRQHSGVFTGSSRLV